MKKNIIKKVDIPQKMDKKTLWGNILLTGALICAATMLWPWLTGAITGRMGQTVSAMVLYAVWIGIVLAMVACKEDRPLSSLGFQQGRLGRQILVGLGLFCVLSLVLTVLPILLGVEAWQLLASMPKEWEIILPYFIYQLCFVGWGEEILYRGFFLSRFREAIGSDAVSVLLSAFVFAASHYPTTHNLTVVAVSAGMGLILAVARLKLRDCSVLSMALAHALFNISLCLYGWVLL